MNVPPLRLIALEITRTCTLACRHCRGDSQHGTYTDELSLEEIRAILDNTATFSRPILIITGGEPLTRPDVFDIAAYSRFLGFRTVLATCGQSLTEDVARHLIDSGVSRISVSLDGSTSETHDRFRGVPGAFDAALRGLAAARRAGLEFQINSTLTALNINELDALYELAVSLGAAGFHPFLLVPMGRGIGLADSALSPEAYETTLEHIARLAANSTIEIKPTCSPHYVRVAAGIMEQSQDLSPAPAITRGHPGGRLAMTRGCLGGQGFVFISHRGNVQICGFLEEQAGDLRAEGYDFRKIWETAPLFEAVRNTAGYHGKCGRCEYVRICGGCRARAFAAAGDYLGEEPNCTYQPKRRPS